MHEYIELEQGNDWGVPYYAERGKARRDGFCRVDLGFMFKNGEKIEVLFPDGEISVIEIQHVKRQTSTSDHGKVDRFLVHDAGFFISHHGLRAWVPLGDVKPRRDMLRPYDSTIYSREHAERMGWGRGIEEDDDE